MKKIYQIMLYRKKKEKKNPYLFKLDKNELTPINEFFKKDINQDITQEFDNYLIEGGFPKAVQYDSTADKKTYIASVISEISTSVYSSAICTTSAVTFA